ncbi:MAG: helix-turn-helix transcriptional regulator [Polyangiaceae bacterium]|nr:helix-turn-helix transcriptional regulator [Polyangiaceae bacterium]
MSWGPQRARNPKPRIGIGAGILIAATTQAALADALGVSQQSVSAVLSGVRLPGLRFALGVARANGMSLETLLSTPSAELARPAPLAA